MHQGQSRGRFENNNAKRGMRAARLVHAEGAGNPVLRPSLLALLVSLAVAVMAVSPTDALAQSAAAAETRLSFNIPAQPLLDALKAFGRQTQLQVLFDDALIEGRQGAAVNGDLSPSAALTRLLAGTGLAAVSTQPGTFTIRAEPTGSSTATLETITVSGKAPGSTTEATGSYTTRSTSSATRLNLAPLETPQSISVITRQRMDDQNLQDLSEVFDSTPGVSTWLATNGGGPNAFYSRGVALNSFQIDGIPTSSSMGNHLQDTAIYDRVEFVHGATGMMNAIGTVGGTVNMIRKRPTIKPQMSFSTEAGNWNRYGLAADVSGPLNEAGSLRGRLVADVKRQGAWVDNFKQDRRTLYGIVEYDLGPSTLLTAGFSHNVRNTKAPMGQRPLYYNNGVRFDITPESSEFPSWSYYDNKSDEIFVSVEHEFNSRVIGKIELNRKNYKYDSLALFANSVPAPGQNFDVSGANYYKYNYAQTNLDAYATASFDLFGRQHEAIAGVNISRFDSSYPNLNATYSSGVQSVASYADLAAPDVIRETGFSTEKVNTYSAYLSSKFNLRDTTKLLLGARWTNWESNNWRVVHATGVESRNDQKRNGLLVPYVGLIQDLNANFSLYGSYTKIFSPNFATTRNLDGSLLDPQEGTSFEAGVKGSFFGGRLNSSLALYETRLDNMPLYLGTGSGNNNYITQNGTKTRGVELELNGELVRGLQVGAGYSFNKITSKDGEDLAEGRPRHIVKTFASYRFQGALSGLTLGGGVNWFSKTSGTALSVNLPYGQGAYAVVNLMARYEINKNISVSLNVNNATNKRYIGGYSSFYGMAGAPRSAMLALKYTF